MNYKLVIFDLDGTLLDTSEGIISSVNYTIDYFGLPRISNKQLMTFIGPPIQDSFAKTYNLKGCILQDIATVFRNRYKFFDLLKAVPYDGIYESLKLLKDSGLFLAVATYKREDYAINLLKFFNFDMYFDIMHGADHYNAMTKADIIEKCISEVSEVEKDDAVLVGDTKSDEEGAKTVGIDFIGVTYGFGYKDPVSRNSAKAIGFACSPYSICSLLTKKE